MSWSPKERAMLAEMGVQLPPGADGRGAAESGKGLEKSSLTAPVKAPLKAPLKTPAIPIEPRAVMPVVGHDAGPSGRWADALGWEDLQAETAACERCGLCRTRRRTVFGVGSQQARWMVLGEAPGEQEDRQGEPFVGPAGQLLDRMLAAIGLTRGQDVFITNTVKCRPPQNRNPQPEELSACAPVLWRQIELVRPRMVLAMGRFAAQQLLSTEEAIGRLRGRVHRLAQQPQVPVVVTYHPAYLLRNPADKGKAWADLCLAMDTAQATSSEGR